ncbi:MAG: hypothetical protein M0026_22165 [Nocardiopsaceae bacterium]|nr:hypothetical protein [Nocardiopsaceae bacterium]
MTADEHPEQDGSERTSQNVHDVLLAADVKRLVRASQEDDDAAVAKIRKNYAIE